MGWNVLKMAVVFQILWRSSEHTVNPRCECLLYSRIFGKDFGTFNTPDYPKPYPTMVDCLLYTFLANSHEVIEITFKDFNVYKASPRCISGDYVKVYAHTEDGKINEYTSFDNVLCGKYSEVPHTIYSSTAAFVLEFHSSEINTNSTGFLGTFRFVDKKMFQTEGRKIIGTPCDMQFDSETGSRTGKFFSPRYPASYPRHMKCGYHFKAKPDERIKIVFEEVLLQKGDNSCVDRQDVIKVYDGWNSASNNIMTLCNEMNSVEVYSTGISLYVEFDAKDRWPGQGFKANYYFQNLNDLVEFKEIQQSEFRNTLNIAGVLNHVFQRMGPSNINHVYGQPIKYPMTRSSCETFVRSSDSSNGTFSSPLYPKPYPSSSRCLFVFQGHGRDRVQIFFNDFNLYHTNKTPKICTGSDSVVIAIKIEGRLERLVTFCGTQQPAPVMSSGPIMAVEFIAYHSLSNIRGFTASYRFVQNFGINSGYQLAVQPCAFEYNNTHGINHGTFTSPNFPGYYPRNIECHYFFHGDVKQKIQLKFFYFDIEGIPPCDENSESDYVEFSNFYMAHDDVSLPRQCGNLSAFTIKSIGNIFRVTFKSNAVLDGTGFQATYQFLDEIEEEEKTQKPPPLVTNKNRRNFASTMNAENYFIKLLVLFAILLHFIILCTEFSFYL